ncbi:MAG: rRNA pseudouridine synthase [Bacteroidales bacterium]|nr:rRNA pseudouridine synthase [Bacteroidales bacterium]
MEKSRNNGDVKREKRTNSQEEPARVYRPRTLTTRTLEQAQGASENSDEHSESRSDYQESEEKASRKINRDYSEEEKSEDRRPSRSFDRDGDSRRRSDKPEGFRRRDDNREDRRGDDRRSSRSFDRDGDYRRRSDKPEGFRRRDDNREDRRGDDRRSSRSFDRDGDYRRRSDKPEGFRRRDDNREDRRGDDRRSSRSFDRDGDYRRRSDKPEGFRRRDDNREDRRGDDRRSSRSFDRDGDYRRRFDKPEGFRRRSDDRGDDRSYRKSTGRYDKFEGRENFRSNKSRSDEPSGYRSRTFQRKHDWDLEPNIDEQVSDVAPEISGDTIIRLNRFISNAGVCSRREADELIENGQVSVNGQVITELGTKVKLSDDVELKGKKLVAERKVYILLNKPKDYVTTVDDPHAKHTVMELIEGACPERVYPVGRLDRNSTGVLLLTNDGELTTKLTHPSNRKRKIYFVGLDKKISPAEMQKVLDGVELDGEKVNVDIIDYTEDSDGTEIGVELHSGQNRVVRRIFDSFGFKVMKLDRVYFAGLTKKGIPRGQWRFLTQKEVNMLKIGRF